MSPNHSLRGEDRKKFSKGVRRRRCVLNIIQRFQPNGFFFPVEKRNVFVQVSSPTAIDITIALMLHFLQYQNRAELQIAITFQLKQSLERIRVVFLEGGNRAMQIALL